jgi:DNA-binding response OmpR family regulator
MHDRNNLVLIVEDDETLREVLVYNFARDGYQVEAVADGLAAICAVNKQRPNIIILDIGLPNMDGFEVCRNVRKGPYIPIIFLSARADEINRVIGFEIGGDDYVTKPFSMRELLARVKARLRLASCLEDQNKAAGVRLEPYPVLNANNDLVLNEETQEVSIDDTAVKLTMKEFELLKLLMVNKGRVLSRNIIIECVWNQEFNRGNRTVDVHIRWLRKKIEKNPDRPVRIITVRGSGYRFDG